MLEQMAREKVLLKRIREKCSKTTPLEVSIIAPTNKQKYIDNIFANYIRLNYMHKELIIILNNNKLNIKDYKMEAEGLKDIRVFQLDENCTLGECLNFGIEQSKYNYISKMDDDDYYGPNYLLDLMNVFQYTDAQLTGKTTRFIYFEDNNTLGIFSPNHENVYVSHNIAGGTLTFQKAKFEKIKFRSIKTNGTDTHFLRDCNDAKIKMFSADKYNYVYMKHRNLDDHTWRISSNELKKYTSKKFSVITDFAVVTTV